MIRSGINSTLDSWIFRLVAGLEHGWIMTFHKFGNGKIIPTDEVHHFSEGWQVYHQAAWEKWKFCETPYGMMSSGINTTLRFIDNQ